MDGTLLAPDHRLSVRTISAIAAARAADIEVLPITGRSFRSAVRLLEPANLPTVVCSNGALTYDIPNQRIADAHPIAADQVRQVMGLLRTRMPHTCFGWETVETISFEPGFHDGETPWASEPVPEDELADVIKLFVKHPEVQESELQHAVNPLLPPGMNASTSGAPFVEVTAAGVDKGSALARIAAARGLDRHEIMAFGDQMNDLTMLQWAGVGVAMGNARPEAVAAADQVTEANGDDGVARAIERLLG